MKERLDVLLVQRGFYQSRERAKTSIMAGIVYVDGQKSDKPGNQVDENAEIFVKENLCPYVSRGGLKLEKSMQLWPIRLADTAVSYTHLDVYKRQEKKNASAEKTRIMDTMEKELSVESMIKSKGLPESFVIMTDSSVTVTVDKQELDSNTVAKICDIVMRETGKTADKIVVQSKY